MKKLWLVIKSWFLKLFFRTQGVDAKVIQPPKPENVELIKNIHIMAGVFGMTRSQIQKDVDKELTGENLKLAYEEIERVFGNRERVDRDMIRRNRKKNGMTFSQVVKKNLK